MISPDTRAKWQQVMELLEAQIAQNIFNLWFRKLQLHDATDSRLTLIAENQFVINSLRSRYRSTLDSAIEMHFKRRMELELILPTQVEERQQAIDATSLNPKYTFDN